MNRQIKKFDRHGNFLLQFGMGDFCPIYSLSVDAEDHVWTGLYMGAKVARFSPDGRLVATIDMPARDITKMAFGGRDLSTAYVTTATKNMTDEDMKHFPLAGSLLAFEAPVKGFEQARAKL